MFARRTATRESRAAVPLCYAERRKKYQRSLSRSRFQGGVKPEEAAAVDQLGHCPIGAKNSEGDGTRTHDLGIKSRRRYVVRCCTEVCSVLPLWSLAGPEV